MARLRKNGKSLNHTVTTGVSEIESRVTMAEWEPTINSSF